MHSLNIVHRDIKLENIMVREQPGGLYLLKIIDFGFGQQVASSRQLMKEFCGTPCYMAPEVVRQKPYRG